MESHERTAFVRRRAYRPQPTRRRWKCVTPAQELSCSAANAEWCRRKTTSCSYRPTAREGSKPQKRACWGNSKVELGYAPHGIENRDGMVTAAGRPTALTSVAAESQNASAGGLAAARHLAPSALMTEKAPSNFQRMPPLHPSADQYPSGKARSLAVAAHSRNRGPAQHLQLPTCTNPGLS